MQINCTAIIQAINFFITYIFLRKVFLRPTLSLIRQKETAKKILTEKLKLKELIVSNLIDRKNKELEQFRNDAKQKYAKSEAYVPEIDPNILSKEQISVSQETIQECKNLIVKGITNAL